MELTMEMLFADFLKRRELVDARVVNQNIELAERLFRLGENALHVGAFATSPWTAIALPPLPVISLTTRSAPSLLEA